MNENGVMMSSPTNEQVLSVSVVTGADEDCVLTFLETLNVAVAHLGKSCRVTVIVNSGSESLAKRVKPLADRVDVRAHPMGFAANHNEVLRRTAATYHLVANDDIVVGEMAIATLVRFMERPENQRVGTVSPKLLNPDLTLQPSTYGFPTVPSVMASWSGLRSFLSDRMVSGLAAMARRKEGTTRTWAHDAELDVETLRGAFVVVRMEAVRDVGLMSEVALVGGEEVEWHARMAKKGWRVVFLPFASVIHRGRVTTGGRPDLEAEYIKGTLNFFALHRNRASFEFLKVFARAKIRIIRVRYRLLASKRLPMHGKPVNQIRHYTTRSSSDAGWRWRK